MPITLDMLKNLWLRLTNPATYNSAIAQFHNAQNNISNLNNRINPPGGSPIQAPQTLSDVWNEMKRRLQ